MKNSTIIIGLAVWSSSLALAYWIGTSSQTSDPETETSATQSEILTVPKAATPETVNSATIQSSEIDGSFDEQKPPLNEALEDISSLSSEEARDRLTEAFALPQSDPNRSQMIRDLLGQIAETDPSQPSI